ncbi:MAG: hypothetical protein K940chlam2_01025 [Chlamydiae bacterium]|nr:hypothetical protein [Chlamydiota bacterium]
MDLQDDRKLTQFLNKVIGSHSLHARWLNSLSYLENCGARSLARFEHPTKVKKEMVKHAAEEFRHAVHLKQQMERLGQPLFIDYRLATLLGGYDTLHYLTRLQVKISRMSDDPQTRYLLTTYAIEKRALILYTLYDTLLKKAESPITIRSVLREEEDHFQEIFDEMEAEKTPHVLREKAHQEECLLFEQWFASLSADKN